MNVGFGLLASHGLSSLSEKQDQFQTNLKTNGQLHLNFETQPQGADREKNLLGDCSDLGSRMSKIWNFLGWVGRVCMDVFTSIVATTEKSAERRDLCVCVREREMYCVCVCVCVRERCTVGI